MLYSTNTNDPKFKIYSKPSNNIILLGSITVRSIGEPLSHITTNDSGKAQAIKPAAKMLIFLDEYVDEKDEMKAPEIQFDHCEHCSNTVS